MDRRTDDPMYEWLVDLFPICRSITGQGVRDTLAYLQKLLPQLRVHAVPSGTPAFDWVVPDEWNIRDAYIADESGQRVVDFRENNLHVLGYSVPVDLWLSRDELDEHLHSLPEQPMAVPYMTSYYAPRWGFCLSQVQRDALGPGRYHAVIDSSLEPGVLNYGELLLPGDSEQEVLLSTYVCHPSMANNELSGPVVTTALARWLSTRERRRFSYRIVFMPETIGSIVYLSLHAQELRERVVAGYVITCVGDERTYSYLESRNGDTLADRAAKYVLARIVGDYDRYSFLERGSDERQYCSPGIDLPVCSVMRSKYETYPEYHTSLDDLDLVTPAGLEGAFHVFAEIIELLESNWIYRAVFPAEPQLGKRGLYPTLSTKRSGEIVRDMLNVLAYADGTRDLIALAERIDMDARVVGDIAEQLAEAGVLERVPGEARPVADR